MAMKEYFITYPGRRLRVSTGNDNIPQYFVTTPASSTKWMFGVVSNKGNRKTPLAQAFEVRLDLNLKGRTGRWFANSTASDLTNGDQGVTPSSFSTPNMTFSTVAYNQAVSKLYEKMRGEVDLSIDLFEAGQAKSMIKKSLKAMTMLSTTFRKMKHSNPRDWGNLWLEFTYGWKPLASSIYGTLELFTRPQRRIYSIRVTGKEVQKREWIQANPLGNGIPSTTVETSSKRCLMQCDFALAGDTLEDLASMSSLNPVAIAWELVPYSFVVDWFVDVGGYLRNMESQLLYRSSFLRGFYTETILVLGDCTSIGRKVTGGNQIDESHVKGGYRWAKKKRTVLGSAPIPRPPRFKADLGSSRLLSAAALLGQQLKSLKHR